MMYRLRPLCGALLALGACVATTPTSTAPRPVADDVRAARLALGPVDDVLVPAADPRPRLRALRDLADQLDNENEATRAAVAVVELSRQRVTLAGPTGDAAAKARRELADDLDTALALIERRKAWWALGQVLDAEEDIAGRGAIHLRALEAGVPWLNDKALDAATAAARTPRDFALIERANERHASKKLDRAALAALGAEFLDVLEHRMFVEAATDQLSDATATAAAIVAIDPLHLEARLLLAYDGDRRAGRLTHRAGLVRAVVRAGDDGIEQRFAPQAVAILEHARRGAPTASSLVLAEAAAMMAAQMPGDAWSLLERTPISGLTELRDDLRGLLALEAGAIATYRTWRDARGGRSSPWVAARELRYWWHDEAAQYAIAQEAARRTFEAGWPALRGGYHWSVAQSVAREESTPRALRERAIAKVSHGEQVVLRYCIAEALSTLSCERLLDAVVTLNDDEGGDIEAAAAALAVVPGTASTWLPNLMWSDAERLTPFAAQVMAIEGTAPALTETWATVAVRVAVARGDTTTAERLLGEYGRLMTPVALAACHLAVADLRAGVPADAVADALAQLSWVRWPFFHTPYDDEEREEEEEEEEEEDDENAEGSAPGDTHAFAQLIDYRRPKHDDIVSGVTAIRARHPGPELAALDVLVALSSASLDAPVTPTAALPDDIPERDLALVLRLRKDATKVRSPLERYLLRRAGTPWLKQLLDPSTPDPLHRAMSVAARERVIDEAAPTEIRARAAEALAAARKTSVTNARELAWLALVAGDVAAARAIATAPDRWRPSEPALPLTHPVRRLLDERLALPDELIRELWQLDTHPVGTEGVAIALRLLEHPSAGPRSAALACRLFVDAEQPDAAIAPCWKAWRGGVYDSDVAVALTWLLNELPDQTAAHGIHGHAFAAAAVLHVADEDEPALWVNLAYWYEKQGDIDRMFEFAGLADRAGWTWAGADVTYNMLDNERAPFLRALAGSRQRPTRGGHFERARLAMAAGDPTAARWYLAAAEGATPDEPADERATEETLIDIVELATRDIAERALTEAEVGLWFRAFIDGYAMPSSFLRDRHKSALVDAQLAFLTQHPDSAEAGERLIEDVPENRFAIVRAVGTLAIHGKRAEAEKALARVRARHPDSALVAAAILAGDRSDDAWLATPAAFDAAMAKVTPAQIAALEPVRVAFGAAETFVPRKKVGDTNIFDLELGGRIAVLEAPNPTRCTGNQCIDSELRGYDASWKTRWRRELPFAGRTAGQMLVDGPPGTVLVTLVPSGGRLFQLVALLPPSKADAMRPAIQLAHDGLRALDLVVPSDRAEALRANSMMMPADSIRFAARRGIAGTGSGCGWIPSGLDTDQRAALLLDVALLEPAFLSRAVACAEKSYNSSALAALAILSDDPAAYTFGKRVATDYGYGVVFAAQTLLAPGQTQASLDMSIGNDRPRRGWLTIAAALPDAGREQTVDKLLQSSAPADRAAGILVAGLVPTDASRKRLRDELALAPAGYAQIAVEALPRPFTAADLTALRRRADRAPATLDATEKRLTSALVRALREAGDPADRDRIARLAKRLGDDPPAALPPPVAGGAPLTDDELRTLALPQLLDRGDWAYARAPQPAAFFAAIRDLVDRLQIATPGDQYLVRVMLEAGGGALSILGTKGGLDLDRPIECASRGSSSDFVCIATIADAAALEKTLTLWPETLSAIRAPQVGAFFGGPASLIAGGAPLLAERAFDEPDPDAENGGFFGDDKGRTILRERARLVSTIGGRSVVRHLIVSANDDGRSALEGASLVIIGDRLVVFGNLAMAESVLLGKPAAGAALADDPAFQAELATWIDGVAIQGFELKGKEQTAVALVPEADGLRFRARHVDDKPTPASRAIGLLPPGAKATLAAGRGAKDSGLEDDSLDKLMGGRGWLLDHDGEVAFGWYPAAGGGADRDAWVIAARANRSLEKSLAAHGLGKLGGALRTKDGLHALRHGDYVVIGSRAELVKSVTTRRPSGDDRNWVSRLDGHALAEAMRARPIASQERAAAVRVVALLIDTIGTVEASNRRVGKADILEGTIRPPLTRAGDTRDVIDRWLTTPQLRNTTRLPRALSDAEVERPLAFVIEMADAKDAAQRLFPTTPRTTVTAIDDTHVRVVVTPAPPLSGKVTATPLDAATRRRTLADDKDVRTSHARIQKLARELAPTPGTATDTAVRVGAWVHRNIRYEVTAEGGDAVDILERGTGDCTEYSLLTVSLLRAAGVPAEIRSGVAAGGGELVAHAWVAFHDGTSWREIDPTWGRTSVGADHIETSVLDFVALVSLDRLVIKAVEVAP